MYSRHRFVPFLVLLLVYLSVPTIVRADAITGTVKDTSAGVVAGARVEISRETLAQPIVLATDDAWKILLAKSGSIGALKAAESIMPCRPRHRKPMPTEN